MKKLIGIVIGVLVLSGASLAFAGKYGSLLNEKSANGDAPSVVIHANAKLPRSMHLKVSTSPKQHVDGTYSVTCAKGQHHASKAADFHGKAPLVRKLKHAYQNPDKCNIGVAASMSHDGKITARLYAR